MNAVESLQSYLSTEEEKINTLAKETASSYSYFNCIELIRQIDVFYLAGKSSNKISNESWQINRGLYQYGWFNLMNVFMKQLTPESSLLTFVSEQKSQELIDLLIRNYGKLSIAKRVIQFLKADLTSIINDSNASFFFSYVHEMSDAEYLDHESFSFVKEVMKKIIEPKRVQYIKKYNRIKMQVNRIVTNPAGTYIAYQTTPEIDEYFSKLGHFHLIGLQAFDDFSEEDIFDGIPYKKYLDYVQDLAGVAKKHLECCLTLMEQKPKVDPYNILTYTWLEDKTAEQFSQALEIPLPWEKKIISYLTLPKNNINFYEEEIGFPPPPYFQLGHNQITRSLYGSLQGSLFFLRKELKRKFPADYFKAVNNREERFRKELYMRFEGNRFIKIDKGIDITTAIGMTDIDALVYDKQTKTLGLFQLKWQAIFAHNLKERFSRQSNLYPKSIEWIDKLESWLQNTTEKDIIAKLKLADLDNSIKGIGEIMIFVLARNHMHFTGQALDERAAWGSWHQVIYVSAKSKVLIDDPIRALHVKLKVDTPESRAQMEERTSSTPFDLHFSNFSLPYK